MKINRIAVILTFLFIGGLFTSWQEPSQGPSQVKAVGPEVYLTSESQSESKDVPDVKKTTSTQEAQRELKLKILIDDSFYNKALKELEGIQIFVKLSSAKLELLGINAQKVRQWNFSTPENLVIGIIQKVSKLYEKRFNISLQIIALERVSFEDEDELLFEFQYMDLLNQQSCDGAEILIGFTAEILYRGEELFTPSSDTKYIIRGTAQPSTNRMFTVLSS